jgi:hypothetical protein
MAPYDPADWPNTPPDPEPKVVFQIDGVLIAYLENDGNWPDTAMLNRVMDRLEEQFRYGTGNRRDWYCGVEGKVIVLTIRQDREKFLAGTPVPSAPTDIGC